MKNFKVTIESIENSVIDASVQVDNIDFNVSYDAFNVEHQNNKTFIVYDDCFNSNHLNYANNAAFKYRFLSSFREAFDTSAKRFEFTM